MAMLASVHAKYDCEEPIAEATPEGALRTATETSAIASPTVRPNTGPGTLATGARR